jgi:hypothetical protein
LKNRRNLVRSGLLCLAFVAIASCSPIPIENIDWVDDGAGFIRFKTNDPERAEQGFVKLYPTATAMPLEVTVKKVLGTVGGGYGLVFYALDEQNFFKVLINVGGLYKITRVIAGGDTVLKDWTDSPALIHGYDAENTLKVTWSGGLFTLLINGVVQTTFPDFSVAGGQSGFYAYVSTVSDEYLPAGQVDIRFKMIPPEPHP